jgi:mannose-1-phosphate guanylyltransferase
VKINLKALILSGGFNTRLRPLSCTRPKILFPIVNKPLIQWTFERLAKNKIEEAILAVFYQTEVLIKQYKIPKFGLKLRYSRDPLKKPLGSGGPIKKAEKLIGHDSPFLVLNGDIFADVNYSEILKVHDEEKAVATIALTKVKDPSRYGLAELAKDGRIIRFIEKPPRKKTLSNLINAGVYVLSPRIFDYISSGKKVSIEYDVFPKLAEEDKLYAYIYSGLWFDIGKPEDYLQINRTLLSFASQQQRPRIGKQAKIKEPVAFDKHISIGEKSIIGPNTVLGRNVRIGNNVRIQNSIILPETVISDSSTVNEAIIGENVVIGKRAKISERCLLGDHVKIDDNVTLAEGVSICPGKEVSESVLTSKNVC